MQDSYISLNPERTVSEEKAIRSQLYQQRLIEAQGGNASVIVGTQWGMTASLLTYNMISGQGFRMFPISSVNTPGYAKLGMAFLAFYMLGHGFVMSKFGDSK